MERDVSDYCRWKGQICQVQHKWDFGHLCDGRRLGRVSARYRKFEQPQDMILSVKDGIVD